jgi:hypothetical protein
MREDNYTSQKLSRLLAEAGFKWESEITTRDCDLGGPFHKHSPCENCQHYKDEKCINIPRYDILNDLCVRYAKKVFGEGICFCAGCHQKTDFENGCEDQECITEDAEIEVFLFHSLNVLRLLQQGKKQEAEQYIIANSILGLDNK